MRGINCVAAVVYKKWSPEEKVNLRLKFQMTQDAFAQMLELPLSTLQHWEQGVSKGSVAVDRMYTFLELIFEKKG